ncbi:uncharacterized protein LOC127808555 [Diospyros lotus]|uniref:uncharacterized protein LOC127808555 n=1 Tax=Diospyros lotus TaxID=55363 RepID=UPI00224EA520|nr:uncharacterized protein LOC127808555 [Diospyros lotus]
MVNQPLSPKIIAAIPSERLRILTIKPYTGTIDPMDHLDLFTSHMMMQDASDIMWCRVFLATLEGHAHAWYSNLAHHSIANFAQLRGSFLAHFALLRRHQSSTMALVSLKQNQGEPLKDFILRFNMDALSIENFDHSVAMVAFQNALRPGPFAQSLAKMPPITSTDILGRAMKYINAEELMQAKRAEHVEKKEKKKHPKERKNEDRKEKHCPRWDSSGFTPLIAPRVEILATIEGKDYLKKPRPMKAPSDKRNRNKYCHFHRDHGHDTEKCHQLKEET